MRPLIYERNVGGLVPDNDIGFAFSLFKWYFRIYNFCGCLEYFLLCKLSDMGALGLNSLLIASGLMCGVHWRSRRGRKDFSQPCDKRRKSRWR